MTIDIKELINSIIEFIKALFDGVTKAKDGVKKESGMDDAANWPNGVIPE